MATAQNVEVAGADVCVPAIVRGNACERREGVHTLLVCSQREWEEEREREKEEEGGRGLVGLGWLAVCACVCIMWPCWLVPRGKMCGALDRCGKVCRNYTVRGSSSICCVSRLSVYATWY